ncbi:hypothetical protein ADICEAN_03332 [Cesiribacter andamanensis AMV16]|uniref:Uncharacterized protein n=1 Tax=Cesiribacter andamanensis AMV16 TaxID=1279009 RepID=M7N2L9_9BACT|nr:hypothetical protein ADICEAN_03332 [Cesiribacter andamanensis AMV16]
MAAGLRFCFLLVGLMLTGTVAMACTTCNPPLQAAIFRENFLSRFLFILLPFVVVGLICMRLSKLK